MYLAACVPQVRARLGSAFGPLPLAAGLIVSGLAPYLLFALLTGAHRQAALLWLLGLCSIQVFWFLRLPRTWWADIGFIVLFAGIVFSKVFSSIYFFPLNPSKVPASILGDLMWTRLAILAVAWFRGDPGVNLSLWPTAREWRIGLREFLYFMPLGIALGYGLQFFKLRPAPEHLGRFAITALAQLAGFYLFVALREEFLFRGLLLKWFTTWWRDERRALLAVSLLFGLVHLPFRQFPNWKFAILASIAGWFYGRAYQQGGGIRAAMVTHALVVFVWRVFLV